VARQTIGKKKTQRAATPRRRATRPNLPERILDVAEELFGRVGYGGAQVFEKMTVLENVMVGCTKLTRTTMLQDLLRTPA